MKKTIYIIIYVILIFTVISCGIISADAEEYTEYLTYEIIDDQVIITDCLTSIEGEIIIPEKIEDLPVTAIKDAFYGCTKLTSIVIPDTVTCIDFNAFYGCTALESITLPFVGANIDGTENPHFGYIFGAENHNKNEDYVPQSIKDIVITKAETIGFCAFYECSSIESITLPPTLKTVGQAAFEYCSELNAVYISDLTAWCSVDFGLENSNPLYKAENLYLNGELITDLVIPSGIKKIEEYVFYNCKSFKTVTVPPSVNDIRYSAFGGCTSIKKVMISDLSAWCNISFSDKTGNPAYYSENLYLNGKLLTKLVVPKDIKVLPSFTFTGCKSLTEIIMKYDIEDIGISTFEDCTELTNVQFSKKLTGITFSSFKNCYKLKSLKFPDSLSNICDNAFENCTSLKEVVLSKNVSNIHSGAFKGCSSLESITLPFLGRVKHSQSPTHLGRIFGAENYYENASYVPKSLKTVNIINTFSINENDFYGCSNITEINIYNTATIKSDGISKIEKNAFNGCANLKTVSIPDTVTSIENNAFSGCDSLQKIKCHNNSYALTYAKQKGILYSICCEYINYIIPANLSSNGRYINKCDVCFDQYIETIYYPQTIKLSAETYTYNGKVRTPSVTVIDANGKKLVKNKDYTLTYSDGRKNAGTHAVLVDFIGKYSGTEVLTFTIKPIPVSRVSAALSVTSYTYDGKSKTPAVTVKNSLGTVLNKNSHYTVTYPDSRVKAGTYKVVIKLKGNYSGTKTLTYKINPASAAKATVNLSTKNYTYNDETRTPNVTVTLSGKKMKKNTDYTVKYATGRKNVGKYNVTVIFKGNYKGTKNLYFTIKPVKTTVKSLTAGKKSLKIAITKKTTQVTGYQIQYATNKSFKSAKLKNVTSYKTISVTIKGLTVNKTYYVRVRTYKTVNGVKYYSGWSTVKYKKTK